MGEALEQLVGGYFHQDYNDEFASPTEAVRAYANSHCATVRNGLVAELDSVHDASESELRTLSPDRLLAYYDPAADGLSYRQWFTSLRAIVSDGLALTPRTA